MIIGLGALAALGAALGRVTGVGLPGVPAVAGSVIGAGVAGIIGVAVWLVWTHGRRSGRPAARTVDPAVRVRAVTLRAETERHLHAIEREPGDAIEPVIFRVWSGTLSEARARWHAWLCFTAIFAALAVGSQVLTGRWLGGRGLQLWLTLVLAELAMAFVFPTYVRIAPGRIDIFRFPWVRGQPEVATYDARSIGLLLDYRRHVVELSTERSGEGVALRAARGWPPAASFWTGIGHTGRERLDAVLRAALTSAPTPTMPERELTG